MPTPAMRKVAVSALLGRSRKAMTPIRPTSTGSMK